MCITRDGIYCPLLSWNEQLSQHNFEERKGPYPKALADRLHEQDIMSREEHLRESLTRRCELVQKQLQYENFLWLTDSRAEEQEFRDGSCHDVPVDDLLPAALWDAFLAKLTESRKIIFLRALQEGPGKKRAEALCGYPEFGVWFLEYLNHTNPYHYGFVRLLHLLDSEPELLKKFASAGSEPYITGVGKQQFYWLFRWTGGRPHLIKTLLTLLDPTSEVGVQVLARWEEELRLLPKGSSKERQLSAKQRRKVELTRYFWQERLAA
jgi:hypothetical protein